MARKARGAAPYGIYHIWQRSTESRCLFESNEERMKFLELIKETKMKYGFKLYAYCLEDKNAYHLIIHANGSDVGKIMKSLNIAYAMFVKFEKPLFKDRYKSVQITTVSAFERIKSEVVCSKVQGSCFNSDSEYCDVDDPFESVCKECIKSVQEAYEKLSEIAKETQEKIEDLLSDKERRNALIVDFRKTSLLSLKELGEVFGGLSESMVSKIIKAGL
jgi:putative transposase